ncbi:MAG: HAMP domain-containing histidine kinase [Colwellia sp.]|nr:HAMP domain-containing histidine kinase [Colwellia sp.]
MNNIFRRLSHEQWLITALASTVLVILSLIIALTSSLGWTALAICSLLFILLYPLVWFAWKGYSFWRQTIMHLSTYTQILKEGEKNLHYKKQNKHNLLLDLQHQIADLAKTNFDQSHQQQTVDNLLSNILDSWSIPVCLFDQDLKLSYRNSAMNEQLQQPMLLGTSAESLGFVLSRQLNNGVLNHPNFNQKWQCQTIKYNNVESSHNQSAWLFTAINVSQLINKNQSITQQSLIRVLAHELRNSLTPMSSMTDTLLCSEKLDEQQTRLVLSRIQQRSDRLLAFIGEYTKLTQLPLPKLAWFNFSELLAEAKSMIPDDQLTIEFQGNEQCFGDSGQMAQVMINLLKNAVEANEKPETEIIIKAYYQQDNQRIEVTDNGPGFANLDNVLTPFYTTKSNGSGIGLSLCAEIIRNHGGQFLVQNVIVNDVLKGAHITMAWPLKE